MQLLGSLPWRKVGSLTVERASRYLIYFILAALPLERVPAFHAFYGGYEITIRLTQIAGVFLIGINLPSLWNRRRQLWRSPWLWLSLFIFAAILSAALAIELKRALMVTGFITFDILLAWVIANRFERDKLDTYAKIFLGSALAATAFGLFQFFGDLRGLPTSVTALLPRYTKGVFGFPRIQSTGYEPLFFADYLLVPSMLAAMLYVRRGWRYLWAMVPMLAVLWITLSRGAYAGAVSGLVIIIGIALWHKQYAKLLGLLAAIGASVLLAVGMVAVAPKLAVHLPTQALDSGNAVDRSADQTTAGSIHAFGAQTRNITSGDSFFNRTETWKMAIKAFKQRPLLGIGPGTFGSFAHRQNPAYFIDNTAIVNNETLELLAEHGLIGAILLIAFAVSLAKIAWQHRPAKFDNFSIWKLGLLAALVGITVQYQTFSTLYITHVWVAIGLLAALVLQPMAKPKS